MSSIVVAGDTSGSVTLQAPAVAGSTVLTLPSVSGTVTTNTTLAGADANIHGLTVGLGAGSVTSNTAFGVGALSSNTSGVNNTAVGSASLQYNTTGGYNVALGGSTLGQGVGSATTFSSCVAVGYGSLANNTGNSNTAIGYLSLLANTTASNNTAVGNQAGYANTTGTNNNTFGNYAGNLITTGSNNLALGSSSASNLTTGSNNIYVGYSFASSASVGGEVVMAFGATGKGGGTSYIQGSAYQTTNSAAWSITSDARLKKNIVDNTIGLSAINAIQVRNFEYRTKDEVTDLPSQNAIEIKGVQLGAIAQELQLILPECVKTESTGIMSVDATNLTWYLINAVKELSAELNVLKLKVGA